MQLVELGGGVGYFKGGLYGFAGSGKTHTATVFALGIKRELNLPGRIGFFDTEAGVEYVAPMIRDATGGQPIGAKSRALSDAIEFVGECEKMGVSVAIVDSTTHIWEEVQKSYLKRLNEVRARRGLNPKTAIEWQDRGPLNDIWQQFTDAYLNSKLHIIICGRAANIWQMEENEEGKKELNKIGTKMKTQSDMAYEPSFLAEMERQQKFVDGKQIIVRVMTVLKDRFRLLDGQQFENPTYEAIRPHVKQFTAGAVNAVDVSRATQFQTADEGDVEWKAEGKKREILSEEIQGLLIHHWPGRSATETALKGEAIFQSLGTRSWTAVQSTDSARLKVALEALPEIIAKLKGAASGNGVDAAQEVVEHFGGKKAKAGKAGAK